MTHSTDRILFLDTLTILDQKGSISTNMYKKSIDICSLLHAQAFHFPPQLQKGPYLQPGLTLQQKLESGLGLGFGLRLGLGLGLGVRFSVKVG